MRLWIISACLFSLFTSCEIFEPDKDKDEIKLTVLTRQIYGQQSGGVTYTGVRGDVKNESSFTVYEVKVRATTSSKATTVDVSPNSLRAGQSGSFDTGYMRGGSPNLEATGRK
jgi:hypothetical protein